MFSLFFLSWLIHKCKFFAPSRVYSPSHILPLPLCLQSVSLTIHSAGESSPAILVLIISSNAFGTIQLCSYLAQRVYFSGREDRRIGFFGTNSCVCALISRKRESSKRQLTDEAFHFDRFPTLSKYCQICGASAISWSFFYVVDVAVGEHICWLGKVNEPWLNLYSHQKLFLYGPC